MIYGFLALAPVARDAITQDVTSLQDQVRDYCGEKISSRFNFRFTIVEKTSRNNTDDLRVVKVEHARVADA